MCLYVSVYVGGDRDCEGVCFTGLLMYFCDYVFLSVCGVGDWVSMNLILSVSECGCL